MKPHQDKHNPSIFSQTTQISYCTKHNYMDIVFAAFNACTALGPKWFFSHFILFLKKFQYYLTDINNVSLMMSLPFVEVARHV